MKKLFLFTSLFLISIGLFAQVDSSSILFKTLLRKDSLVFNVGFNTCNVSVYDGLVAEDLEFYHDQGGITHSKREFIEIFKNGICKSEDFVSRRELISESVKVFPLYDNGVLYGAIQMGEHRFYEKPKGKPERDGSIAKFTHLWLLNDSGDWILKRVLSYDHRMHK